MTEQSNLTFVEATRMLVWDAKREVVSKGVQEALYESETEETAFPTAFLINVLNSTFGRVPEYIDPMGFMQEFGRLNAPVIWTQLYQNSPLVNRQIFGRDNPYDNTSPLRLLDAEEYCTRVSASNSNFFVPHTLALASTVFGVEVADDLEEINREFETVTLEAQIKLARYFHTGPKDLDETVERLRYVFPRPGQVSLLSGIDAFHKARSFYQRGLSEDSTRVEEGTCPAPIATELIYAEFGMHLATEEYQALFKRRVAA